jgi:competence protein ComFB
MEIRNLMEDAVLATVSELFELEEKDLKLGFCTCGQCRLDVACYVLNRIKPEYILSGRGLAYSERDMLEKVQRRADIITIAREGWSKVGHNPRVTADHEGAYSRDLPLGPAFNIPTIMGRAFNGLTYEPLSQGTISLFINGILAPMVDRNWQNPFILGQATSGTFIFWPRPEASTASGSIKSFSCELRVEVDGFDPLSHYFEFDVVAEGAAKGEFSLIHSTKIPDLTLFPKGTEEGQDD